MLTKDMALLFLVSSLIRALRNKRLIAQVGMMVFCDFFVHTKMRECPNRSPKWKMRWPNLTRGLNNSIIVQPP